MAGLSLLVALAAVTPTRCVRDPPYVAPPPRSTAPRPGPRRPRRPCTPRGPGRGRRRRPLPGLAPDDDPAAADLLRAVAGNAADLGLVRRPPLRRRGRAASTPTGPGRPPWPPPGGYAADRDLGAELGVTVRAGRTADGVAVTGFGGPAPARPGLARGSRRGADAGGVAGRGRRVTGASAAARPTRYQRLAAASVGVVGIGCCRTGAADLVVEVPATSAALDRALDAEPGHTAASRPSRLRPTARRGTDSPVHVFVNPEVFDRLQPTGAQVVLSHEAVHVATDAARSDVALWLLEGFADYVALRDVDLPLEHHGRADHPSGAPGRRARDAAGAGRVSNTKN